MRSAQKSIHFESFIIHEDDIGDQFSDLLAAKAKEGVSVRLIYDWLGAFGKTSHRFWERLSKAGVHVRCFNPFRFDSPFGWLSRDHRKMISVDGRIGFVTGLCVGRMWVGYPDRGIEPWRDTGVEVLGPAVADIEHAFAEVWTTMGSPLPEDEIPRQETIPAAGDVTTGDGYNFAKENYLVTPQQRIQLFGTGDLKLGSVARGYFEASYVNRQSGQDLSTTIPSI